MIKIVKINNELFTLKGDERKFEVFNRGMSVADDLESILELILVVNDITGEI